MTVSSVRRRTFALAITTVFLAALVASAPAEARPKVSVSYSYFSVSGGSALQLLRNLEIHGPNVDGTSAYAATSSKMDFTGSLVQAKTCQLRNFGIIMKYGIRLPRAKLAGTSSSLKSAWRAFDAFLRRHEITHTTIWTNCASQLEARIRSLRIATCDALSSKIDSLISSSQAACNAKHDSFDRAERARLAAQPLVKRALKAAGQ